MGFVYAIQEDSDNFFKIGASETNVEDRLKNLQTGNSCELRIFGVIECDSPYELESEIHKILKEYWVRNEWFCVDPVNIVDIIESKGGKIMVDNPLKIKVSFDKDKQQSVKVDVSTAEDKIEAQMAHAAYVFNVAQAIAVRNKRFKFYLKWIILAIAPAIVASAVLCFLACLIKDTMSFFITAMPFVFPVVYSIMLPMILDEKNPAIVTMDDIIYEKSKIDKSWKRPFKD